MKSIYKYQLVATDEQLLFLQGTVLSVGVQDGSIMVWAVHDDELTARKVRISVRGTGHELTDVDPSCFVGTVFIGPLVFHVFASVTPS